MKIDKITFRKDFQGRNVYFPFGIGKGYVLPGTKVESQIKVYLKFRNILMYGSTLPIVLSWSHVDVRYIIYLVLVLIGINFAVWFIGNLIFFRNLEVIFDRSNAEMLSKQIREPESFIKLFFVLVASFAFVAAGIFVYLQGQTGIAIACIAFFGLCAVVVAFQIMAKMKSKKIV